MSSETHFVSFCVAGLQRMYLSSEHVFPAAWRLVHGAMKTRRDATQEYRYTLNTLMGLRRAQMAGSRVFLDIGDDYRRLAVRASEHSRSTENIAAVVWTGRCLEEDIPSAALALFQASLIRALREKGVTAQGLAWLILACVESGQEYRQYALELVRLAASVYVHPRSGLVMHTPRGFRSRWASFAASAYMAYALLRATRKSDIQEAREIAMRICRSLVRLQGPRGEWAWFYDVPGGRVVDWYPLYSVHQDAMAPFFLLEALDQGYHEFREPLVRGFRWILGEEHTSLGMIASEPPLIWRSARRREPLSRLVRFARAVAATHKGAPVAVCQPASLTVNKECRSYELGWALWAFAGRAGFDDMLNHPSFRCE